MAPMPYIPGEDKSKMKNLPYIPGKDKSKMKNLPYIPGEDKSKVRPMPSFPGTGKGKVRPMPTPKGYIPGKGKMAPMPTPKGYIPGKGKMAPMPTPKGYIPGEPETDPFAIYREQIASLREQIASLREEPNEGNKFSGALAQANQDGKEEFEVDGNTYKVTEMFDKQDEVGSKKKTKHGTAEKTATGMKHTRDYKPDYLDLDGDGDKKEPMKKAAKDKKAKEKK